MKFVIPDPTCGGELNDANWIDWWYVDAPLEPTGGIIDKSAGLFQDWCDDWAKQYTATLGFSPGKYPTTAAEEAAYLKWKEDATDSLVAYLRAKGCTVEGPCGLAWAVI
jgi:hypothetical protein